MGAVLSQKTQQVIQSYLSVLFFFSECIEEVRGVLKIKPPLPPKTAILLIITKRKSETFQR